MSPAIFVGADHRIDVEAPESREAIVAVEGANIYLVDDSCHSAESIQHLAIRHLCEGEESGEAATRNRIPNVLTANTPREWARLSRHVERRIIAIIVRPQTISDRLLNQ